MAGADRASDPSVVRGTSADRGTAKAYLVGGGIGSLAAAAFMIRDGSLPGGNISILEAATLMGGSLDGAGDPAGGYSLRGGRMLTTDNYECTWEPAPRDTTE
jgi:oleate hydratase